MPDVLMDTGVIFALLPFQSLEQPGVKPGVKHKTATAELSKGMTPVCYLETASAPANKSMANTIIRRNIND